MPDAPHGTMFGILLDVGALLLVGGAACATWAVRRAAVPPIPVGDPFIDASLAYATD